ncbi:FMN-dependent dehydrogenase [Xylariomycetidae sp. FL2044]|nr:FMN-dependent dehydrogenase [Xylariomycetidae sp. FL2044]
MASPEQEQQEQQQQQEEEQQQKQKKQQEEHPEQPDALLYEHQVFASGLHSRKPPFTFETSRWASLAREALSATSWGYVHNNAGAGSTAAKNVAAFGRYSILPRYLRPSLTTTTTAGPETSGSGATPRFSSTATTVLGQKLAYPLALAPVGVQKIFHREGEAATARAAAAVGVPMVLSSASSMGIEEVAAASGEGSPRWFQLYWPARPEHDDVTISLLGRARASGYTALVVTIDAYILGWRPGDMDNGYSPFVQPDRIGAAVGFTDPAFRARFRARHGGREVEDAAADGHALDIEGGDGARLSEAKKEWSEMLFPGHSHAWEDLAFLKEHWDGPIDDGGCASLAVLPRIVDAVGHRLDVLFDSGVRCGADIIKAVALGAKCVLVGRPYVYGLALGGEDGVKHVLRSLCGEVVMGMHLAGLREMQEVTREVIVKDEELF